MSQVRRTERRAGRTISICFVLSALASIGLTVLYGLGGQPQLEGALIFVAAGGFSVALILWGKRLLPEGPFVEEREQMTSPPKEREAFARDWIRSEHEIRRRSFLGRMLLLALGAFGAAAVFPVRSLGPAPGNALFVTPWRRGSRLVDSTGKALAESGLEVGTVVTVFPEGHVGAADAPALLINTGLGVVQPLPGRTTWSPDGFVCYSKICTHAGCPVGLYEQQTHRLFCPCHQSVFDVANGAAVLSGPAQRALPQLPIEVGPDGYLRAQGGFSEPIGPGWWNGP